VPRAGKKRKEAPPEGAREAPPPPPPVEERPRTELEAWLDAFLRDRIFLERYRYYAAVLAKMVPVADPSVARMAVSLHEARFFLHINVDAFLREPQYLRGVLLHEVHHVVLGHLTHPKFADAVEPELMELAIEMSANEYIEEPLPNPITWRAYAAVGIRAGQSTLERYEHLLEAARGTSRRPRPDRGESGDDPAMIDDHRFLRMGDRAPGGVQQTRDLLQRAVADAKPPPNLDAEGSQPLLAGRSPGRLLEELGAAVRPTDFLDWKSALRMFVARGRAPVHTYARPSRRLPHLVGSVPGRAYAPRLLVRPRLVVAIDTSLSMTRAELEEIGRQLTDVARHAAITIAECDVEITRVYPFGGSLSAVMGRGGTDLRPVFAPSFLGREKPDGIVYFTDGEGPFPDEPAPLPTLWVLTKPEAFLCPWGERAWLGRGPKAKTPLWAPPPPGRKPKR
jgi:predicted metal-dependent peptidase